MSDQILRTLVAVDGLVDRDLVELVLGDLTDLLGVTDPPVDARVSRWGGGLPQYGVAHLELVAEVERAVAEVPGLAIAGAALHGVGVPACVATGQAAATGITQDLLRVGGREVGR